MKNPVFVAMIALLMLTVRLASAGQPAATPGDLAVATFAGGCFWCMEPPFDKLEGVVSTTSGYTGGDKEQATYEEVSAGGTGHFEALRVIFDPARISYADLLAVYWRNVDPLDAEGQFCDRGTQYRAAIFWHDEQQRKSAMQSKARVAQLLGQPVAAAIRPAGDFWPAEEYHQNYYRKNPIRYRFYRFTCGRDQRLAELWEAHSIEALASGEALPRNR